MKILLVEDNISLAKIIKLMLEGEGYTVRHESDGIAGIKAFEKEKDIGLVITDIRLPSVSGMDVLNRVKALKNDVPVIMMTAYGNIPDAIEAIKKGAYDYITKPFDNDEFLVKLKRALEETKIKKENQDLKDYIKKSIETVIIGESHKLRELLKTVETVAPTDASVLITGESGVGKELFAKKIHVLSKRADKPFVVVNCAAIPESLFESELFGHKKGAFTGAERDRTGKFEEANWGTIFLDEVAELPAAVQAKLLRFLQEREVVPLGSNTPLVLDVRIISATNRDIKKLVQEGRFREDLYYRLNVFPLHIPSLRERKEDIPLLVRYFAVKYGYKTVKFTDGVMARLLAYQWQGNVRELENIVYRLCILARGGLVDESYLPQEFFTDAAFAGNFTLPEDSFDLEAFEKKVVNEALVKFRGNKTKAAEYLKMPRHILIYRLEKWGWK